MTVPDYESLMRPTLLALADGVERTTRELYDLVATSAGLSAEERELLLPSGKQTVFVNRVGWAVTYMAKAGLIRRPRRGVAVITERGKQLLRESNEPINGRVLERFPEFVEFRELRHTTRSSEASSSDVALEPGVAGSPSEAILALVEEVNSAVAAEVLERVLDQPPHLPRTPRA